MANCFVNSMGHWTNEIDRLLDFQVTFNLWVNDKKDINLQIDQVILLIMLVAKLTTLVTVDTEGCFNQVQMTSYEE